MMRRSSENGGFIYVLFMISMHCLLVFPEKAMGNSVIDTHGRLMVLLVDGFRWDYVERNGLENFKRLWEKGAKADYMENDFPTLSYPNYYTLMTGLHTESHGMTGNYMYDPKTKKSFLIGTNEDQYLPLWWENGEPLWVSAVKQKKTSYMFYWPGCEVTIHGRKPTMCFAYTDVPTIQEVSDALDQGLKLITNGTANLVGVYSEQPDHEGHKYGPYAEQTKKALKGLDTQVGLLLDHMDDLPESKKFNFVVMSDHGMTMIDPSRVINITDALNTEVGLYTMVMENAAIASVYTPNQETENKVYNLLKDFNTHMKVYRKQDIPERFHYKRGPFVSRITCIADLGWTIVQPQDPVFPNKGGAYLHGHHGFDNLQPDMRGIFYAVGPYFKTGSRVDHIRAVDPYNLMCDVLSIDPSPNNGTISVFDPLIARSSCRSVSWSSLLFLSVVFLKMMLASF